MTRTSQFLSKLGIIVEDYFNEANPDKRIHAKLSIEDYKILENATEIEEIG